MEQTAVIAEIKRVQQELALLLPTALESRWSGEVEIEAFLEILGQKKFTCGILLDEMILQSNSRWIVYSHELLHSFSAGYSEKAYKEFRGYEEGVVEAVERLLRLTLLQGLELQFDRLTNAEIQINDDFNDYNRYITALEAIRILLGYHTEERYEFYTWLIAVPLEDRSKAVITAAMQVLQNVQPNTRGQIFNILFAADEILRQS